MKTLPLISPSQFRSIINYNQPSEQKTDPIELVRQIQKNFRSFEIVKSSFTLLNDEYHHYQSIITDESDQTFAGHGRSLNEQEALLKSINESLERFLVTRAFSDFKTLSGFEFILNKDFDLTPKTEIDICIPSNGFRTSNGWSVSQDLGTALRRSFCELIERDSLQRSFWSSYLGQFKRHSIKASDPYVFHFLTLDSGWPQLQVQMAAAESQYFPGIAFGHNAIINNEPSYSGCYKWHHPLIEAFQIAESYIRTNGTPSNSIFDQIQYQYLADSNARTELLKGQTEVGKPILSEVKEVPILATVFDLAKPLQLSCPLYGAWVQSPFLLPLFLELNSTDKEKNLFEKRCRSLGVTSKIIQTPFV